MAIQVFLINTHKADPLMLALKGLGSVQVQVLDLAGFAKMPAQANAIHVLCLSAQWADELALLRAGNPALSLDVVITPVVDAQLSRQVIKLGVKDFFVEPFETADLLASIKALCNSMQERVLPTQATQGSVSAFINAKGGAGATFLATNMGQLLASASKQATVLVDLDTQFGGASNYLDLEPEHNVIAALSMAKDLDRVGLPGYLARHRSGLNLMGSGYRSTRDLLLLEEVNASGLEPLLSLVKNCYSQVILDVPRYLNLLTVTALQQSNMIYVVVQQSLAHLNDALKLLRTMREDLFIEDQRICIVVNRYDKKNTITLADIEKMLRLPSIETVSNDYKVATTSLNNAEAVFEFAKGKSICTQLMALERRMGGGQAEQRGGLFQRLFSLD